MPFKKMRTTINHYRDEASSLDPAVQQYLLSMLARDGYGIRKAQRVVRSDPQLAIALCLLEWERDKGWTAAQFNEMARQTREGAVKEGISEEDMELFLQIHFQRVALGQ